MKKYTINEFFEKTEWEGDFEEMANYCGQVSALRDLEDVYDEWQATRPEEDYDQIRSYPYD